MSRNWNLKTHVFDAELSVSEYIDSIVVFDRLSHKYPNDEHIKIAIEILRNEICQMFGGTIYSDEYVEQ